MPVLVRLVLIQLQSHRFVVFAIYILLGFCLVMYFYIVFGLRPLSRIYYSDHPFISSVLQCPTPPVSLCRQYQQAGYPRRALPWLLSSRKWQNLYEGRSSIYLIMSMVVPPDNTSLTAVP